MRRGIVPTVAVVDRDEINCKLVREVCLAGGWEVVGCASDVSEGLSLVRRTRPDCLITDFKFDGDATGLDLIVRARHVLPDLFTVMLTGWDINDIAARLTSHVPDRILRKPLPPHALMNLLAGFHGQVDLKRAATG